MLMARSFHSNGSIRQATNIVKYLNDTNKQIHFTLETQINKTVNFLDHSQYFNS